MNVSTQSKKPVSLQTLFRKSQFSIFAITFFICSSIFVSISIFTVQSYAKQNLMLVGKTVSERIQPALVFNDVLTLNQILKESTDQHSIRLIQVFNAEQQEITQLIESEDNSSFVQRFLDRFFLNEAIKLPIYHHDSKVGELHVYGSSAEILKFVLKILLGLAIGMLFIIFALWRSINLTYRRLMQAISPIQHTAQLVNDQKAYNLRFSNNPITEFQNLNNTFNSLLEEIQTWHNHLQNENNQLSYEAHHDHLTQLPNRNFFYQSICQLFDDKQEKMLSALLFIDNNNFKEINDKYGHLAGDAVLQEMAKRLNSRIRHDDFVARLGGDEFAVILKSIKQIDHLIYIAENLLKSCEAPLDYQGQNIHFTFSIGIALAKNANSPEELISQADQAMYKAKSLNPHWFIFQP